MTEPLSTDPYKGVRDFYPSDWATLSRAFGIIRERLSLWGYEEYAASPLERHIPLRTAVEGALHSVPR